MRESYHNIVASANVNIALIFPQWLPNLNHFNYKYMYCNDFNSSLLLLLLLIGRFQKITITIPRTAFRISKGEGGSRLWNSEGMGVFTIGNPKAWGISQVGFLE